MQQDLLRRIILRLGNELGSHLFYHNNGQYIDNKIPDSPVQSFPFSDGELQVPASILPLSPENLASLKSAQKLAILVGNSIRPMPAEESSIDNKAPALGRLSVSAYIHYFYEIEKTLQMRSTLLSHYDAILQLNKQILEAEDLAGVLQLIMDVSKEAVGADSASLLLVDARTGEMYFNTVSGDQEEVLSEIRIPPGQGIAGDVVASGHAELIPDVSKDKRIYRDVDEILNNTTKNMIIAPIPARGRIIGVIEVINSLSEKGFGLEDLEFLRNIASHTGLLIENARSRESLKKTNILLDTKARELQALSEIGRAIKSEPDDLSIKKNLIRSCLRIMQGGLGCILIPEEKGFAEELSIRYEDGAFLSIPTSLCYEESSDIKLWFENNKEPLFLKHPTAETKGLVERFKAAHPELFSGSLSPGVWIPVFNNQSLYFIASLNEAPFLEKSFYRDLMEETAFVLTLAGALKQSEECK